MKILLVTLAIGENYLKEYNLIWMKSQSNYAAKHGYDFKVITEYLDTTYIHPHQISFHKLLVGCQPWSNMYDYIIFIDADIYINPDSPPIHLSTNFENKVGIVDEYSQPTPDIRIKIQKYKGWETSATDYYKLAEFTLNTDIVLNSGVFILQPKLHGEFFRDVFYRYVKNAINNPRGFHCEQSSIGYELQKNGICEILSNKYNACINLYRIEYPALLLEDFIKENYFIHFAGKIRGDDAAELVRINTKL